MNIETLEDLAKELKTIKTKMFIKFLRIMLKNNLSEEELEQKLSKEHDCFKCDSCENSIVMMNTHSLMKSVFTVLIVKLTMKRSFNPTHHQNLLLIHLELLKHQ